MPSKIELPGHGSELNTKIAKATRAWRQQEKRIERINKRKNHKKIKTTFEKAQSSKIYEIKVFKNGINYFMLGSNFPEEVKPINASEVNDSSAKNPPAIIQNLEN